MQILSKKRFKFGKGSTTFTTKGGNVIEACPDWVAQDKYFQRAVHAKAVYVIKSAADAAVAEAEVETAAVEAEAEAADAE